MKPNMTRSWVLTAIFAGVLGLAGCDKGSDSSAPATPGATSEAPAAPAAEPTAPAESAPAPAESAPAPAESSTAPAASSEAPAPSTDAPASSEAPAAAGGSSTPASEDSSLPQACQDYFKKAEDMVTKAGGSAEQMNQMIEQQRSQMSAIKDQAQLESSCKQALDMLAQQEKNMPQ